MTKRIVMMHVAVLDPEPVKGTGTTSTRNGGQAMTSDSDVAAKYLAAVGGDAR